MARHGKDLWDVLTGLDLDDVVLIGGSMGVRTNRLGGLNRVAEARGCPFRA
jgi:hypothetical protein